jgi:hypothetical protein
MISCFLKYIADPGSIIANPREVEHCVLRDIVVQVDVICEQCIRGGVHPVPATSIFVEQSGLLWSCGLKLTASDCDGGPFPLMAKDH